MVAGNGEDANIVFADKTIDLFFEVVYFSIDRLKDLYLLHKITPQLLFQDFDSIPIAASQRHLI